MSLKEKENHMSKRSTENLVSDYLRDNLDFFVKNPSIIAELKIPHESGDAISLVEKQLAILRSQNQETQKKIHELIEIARQNEELARRMHQLALTLMDENDPEDIFSTLYKNLKKNFYADRVVVKLFANSILVSSSLTEEFVGKDSSEELLFRSIIKKLEPLSGKMKRQQQVFLFGEDGDDIASSVMIPLHGHGWGGILAIGSFDEEHFQSGMGIELLSNFAEILSFIIKPWVKEN
jgi:uncharacterized protein YigA (DUF484 family)